MSLLPQCSPVKLLVSAPAPAPRRGPLRDWQLEFLWLAAPKSDGGGMLEGGAWNFSSPAPNRTKPHQTAVKRTTQPPRLSLSNTESHLLTLSNTSFSAAALRGARGQPRIGSDSSGTMPHQLRIAPDNLGSEPCASEPIRGYPDPSGPIRAKIVFPKFVLP